VVSCTFGDVVEVTIISWVVESGAVVRFCIWKKVVSGGLISFPRGFPSSVRADGV
jgi:hypothetical protein